MGVKGLAAVALLREGYSLRKVHEVTGISETTASALRKNNLVDPALMEAIRKQLQDRFAMVAHGTLAAVDHEKLKVAGAGELVRSAAVASDRAGIDVKESLLNSVCESNLFQIRLLNPYNEYTYGRI